MIAFLGQIPCYEFFFYVGGRWKQQDFPTKLLFDSLLPQMRIIDVRDLNGRVGRNMITIVVSRFIYRQFKECADCDYYSIIVIDKKCTLELQFVWLS